MSILFKAFLKKGLEKASCDIVSLHFAGKLQNKEEITIMSKQNKRELYESIKSY